MRISSPIFWGVLGLMACSALELSGQDPRAIQETYFPVPDTTYTTPAFDTKRGFTTHETMEHFLLELVQNSGNLSMDSLGMSAKGKVIWGVRSSAGADKLRVLFLGGLHGNEPAGTEALLAFMQQLSEEGHLNSYLDAVELLVIPMANPDGYDKQNRYAANGLDLNRDQTKLVNQEVVFLKKAYAAFDADVVVDFHEYKPYRSDFVSMGTFGVTSAFDAMFLYTGNLNVAEPIREATETLLVDPARKTLAAHGRRFHNYIRPVVIRGNMRFDVGATSAHSSSTSFALANSLSVLMEIRGVGLQRKGFERRVETGYLLASSFLKSAHHSKVAIQMAREQGRNARQDVVIESSKKVTQSQLDFIDLSDGSLRTFDIEKHDGLVLSPQLIRSRPMAYIILPEAAHVIEKLRILDVEVEPLPMGQYEVERYVITENRLKAEFFEGFQERIVSATTESEDMDLPADGWWVPADQERFNLAIECLEPEAHCGLIRYRVLEIENTIPILRVIKPTLK
ncbi:MAG: M14 family zinc carboxypeptidase [Bacteroidetes bacterium]|nr:M14 family zinc carboxypeptidase [Bacteroidota bacterium]